MEEEEDVVVVVVDVVDGDEFMRLSEQSRRTCVQRATQRGEVDVARIGTQIRIISELRGVTSSEHTRYIVRSRTRAHSRTSEVLFSMTLNTS
jgi:hypothetical protein